MKRHLLTLLLCFASMVYAQNLGNKNISFNPPYPRLGIMTWYTPRGFADGLRSKTDSLVTINDPNKTALLDFLSAHQYVQVRAGAYQGNSPQVVADRDRLAQTKATAGFLLLGIWASSGNEPDNCSFDDKGPYSPLPFVPEWFVQEVVRPLRTAVDSGGTVLPIDSLDLDAYCLWRDTGYENDQVIIMDPDPAKREAVILKCSTWDRSSDSIHLTTIPDLRSPYDFGSFKYNHARGTPVRLNVWHDWGNWWGYNMTDVGPTFRGMRWNEYRPRIIHYEFKQIRDSLGQLLFDGVLLDTFNQLWFTQYSSNPVIVKRLDLDADSIPDWQEQNSGVHDPTGCYPDYWSGQPNWDNCVWASGHTTFTQKLRALWDGDNELRDNHNILMQHEFGKNADYMNGQSFEGIPNLELSPDIYADHWQTAFEHYQYWEKYGQSPRICFIFTNCSNPPDSPDSYKQMRLALSFTLMDSGYFWHSPYCPGIGFNGDALWWFDEYAVDSSGQAIDVYARPAPHPLVNIRTDLLEQGQFAATVRPGLGYLGYPVTARDSIGIGVYRRDFQRGIVLANFSRNSVTLSLERAYRKIKGIQAPNINDGSLATSVTLPAKDAIILLNPDLLTGVLTPYESSPIRFSLSQNYPNPFNPSTTIRFSLPLRSLVTLKVFDVLGREVATLVDGEMDAGEHSVVYNVKDLPSGVYFYRLQAGNFVEQKKMVFVK